MTGKRREYLRTDAALWVMVKEIPSLGKIQLDYFLAYRLNTEYTVTCHVQVNPTQL